MLRSPEVNIKQKLQWMLQIAEGLRHTHSKGVVHRDLALSNTMLNANKDLKIIDFNGAYVLLQDKRRVMGSTSFRADIFDFTSAAYSLMMWRISRSPVRECLFALHGHGNGPQKNRGWLRATDLPNMERVPFGDFLLDCWLGNYDDMDAVCTVLRDLDLVAMA